VADVFLHYVQLKLKFFLPFLLLHALPVYRDRNPLVLLLQSLFVTHERTQCGLKVVDLLGVAFLARSRPSLLLARCLLLLNHFLPLSVGHIGVGFLDGGVVREFHHVSLLLLLLLLLRPVIVLFERKLLRREGRFVVLLPLTVV